MPALYLKIWTYFRRKALLGKAFLPAACLLAAVHARAQDVAEFRPIAQIADCTLDLRPIGSHNGLPEGALYQDVSAPIEARAADVVKRLSFEEKLALTGGYKQFYFPGVERLGIPPVYFADATQGIHEKTICAQIKKTTAFPSGQALAATWDTALAEQYATAISEECRAWGVGVLLGPGLNLYRNSEGGRNFEYFGEDPFLTSQMGVAYVRGMQGGGTVATVKHFIGNEQEFVRHTADVQISERALRELYLPPFKATLEAGALAVMTGNNLVNGHPGAADTPLSEGVLRREYGFRGMIMSDWANSMYWPNRSGEELTSGHSLLMENNAIFTEWVHAEVAAHPERKATIEAELGRMAEHNLYTFFRVGIYDRPSRDASLEARIDAHQTLAREVSEASITLLKNEGNVLPLVPENVKRIAVVGSDEALTVYGGKGSGAVKGYNHVNFMAGLQEVYGEKVSRVAENDDKVIRNADAVLVFIAKKAGENIDVPFDLPETDSLIEHIATLNHHVVVIASGGNGFSMPWLPHVPGLVFAYLQGQQRGVAMANVLSGKVNPSGRLPFTIEKSFRDSPAFNYNRLPDGTYGWGGSRTDSFEAQKRFGTVPLSYKEGIYIGYRWYQKRGIVPQFPFGFGLSYTTFAYGNAKSSIKRLREGETAEISLTVRNTGARAGVEVIQLYIHSLDGKGNRPEKELKGFTKVALQPGESRVVTLPVSASEFAYYDEEKHGWKILRGRYEVQIGASVEDIRTRTVLRY